ncbi:transposase, partial [Camelimonas lactis]
MPISEFTLKSRDDEPVRRLEIFTGSGRRRDWSPEEKDRIVAESHEGSGTVSAVARRHGLTPQQLFTWRREARQRMEAETLPAF